MTFNFESSKDQDTLNKKYGSLGLFDRTMLSQEMCLENIQTTKGWSK
jgi:hypothetical protein